MIAVERLIAFRYLRARRDEGFISVIAGFSLVGIALGVGTLIVVMAVMNGFQLEMLRQMASISGQLGVQGNRDGLSATPDLMARLRAVPGVGPKSALPLLVLLFRWQALTAGAGDAKGWTAYVGLDPQTHESGTSVRGRGTITRMGNRAMRSRLYMCALGGVKGRNGLRAYYERLVGRGKSKKLALVAAARKVLLWAWAVFRDQVDFAPEKVAPAAV